MSTTLIKNGTLVTASEMYAGDLFIEDGKIKTLGRDLNVGADNTVDAEGCFVFPGGIDPHTHMELPFMGTHSSDDFYSGTLAGLHGGTTSIIDFAIQTQGKSMMDAYNQWMEKAAGKAVGDYAFHLGVTDFNDETKKEMTDLVNKYGVTSFKTFMAYKGALMIDDRMLLGVMREAKKLGGIVTAHTEHGDVIDSLVAQFRSEGKIDPKFHAMAHPELAETEAAGRFVDLAHQVDHPCYIVHMTCEGALNRVREAARRNQKVYVETCIQYLLLDDSLYEREGFEGAKWVMSPPLRKKKDQQALWAGIEQNLIHTVATDHCPFCMDQKEMGKNDFAKIPNGAPGIEHRMELLWSEGVATGTLSPTKFVDLTSTAAAKIFGLYPRKGTLAPGADADVVIFDPKVEHTISAKTHHHNCDYSAYEGWKVKGKTRSVFLRGQCVIENGVAKVEKGNGQYLKRDKFKTARI